MIIYLVVIFNIINVINAGLIHNSFDIKLEDSGEFVVEESFREEDFEMIKDNELKRFSIDDRDNKFYALNRIASKEYEKYANRQKPKTVWFRGTTPTTPSITDITIALFTMYRTKRTHIEKRNSRIHRQNDLNSEYNYNDVVKEYYGEAVEEARSNKTFHAKADNDTKEGSIKESIEELLEYETKTRNCTEEEIKHIGFKAVNCIIHDFKHGKAPPEVLAQRLGRIVMIWFIIYLIVATPFWCTRGWCCCCLFCKFFNPRHTIDRAKVYFVKNPPGLLTRNNGEVTRYTPTEYEVHSYQEFDHFIINL